MKLQEDFHFERMDLTMKIQEFERQRTQLLQERLYR